MKLVVALDAKYKCLAFSCDHKPLPCLRTFLYVRQFLDVMDLTVCTFVGVLPSQEFASIRVLEGEGWPIYFVVEDHFALHVFGFEESYFSSFPGLSLFPYRHIRSTVQHGRYFLHRHFMLVGHSLKIALYPKD